MVLHVMLLKIKVSVFKAQLATYTHRRSQDFCWGGGGTRPTPPSLASVVHTFEAVAGSRGSVSAPAVSRVMGGAPERNKNSKKYLGEGFVNVVSLRYIGMIYINVGEMFIPMSVHNELFNGVRQLRWRHLSPVV